MEMIGNSYFWQNDYAGDLIEDFSTLRDIELIPDKALITNLQFSKATMEPIIAIITNHINRGHKIAICGDYDVDGTTATAIICLALKTLNADVIYYIPDRFTDGYGINERIIDDFIENNVQLIITVDNGIVAFEAINYAKKKGLDIVVTDHHEPGIQEIGTDFVLHPKLDDTFAENDVCGAVVAFVLARELMLETDYLANESIILQYAMLATLADMMPLQQPINRAFSYYGYKAAQKRPLLILQAFKNFLQVAELTSDFLSFQCIPRINAVGRMAQSNVVVDTLLSQDLNMVLEMVESFDKFNLERKNITDKIVEEAIAIIEKKEITQQSFLFIYHNNWHQGVLGIVAQKLMQHFGKAIIIITNNQDDENLYTGSARAFGELSVKACFDFINKFALKAGGHQYAGGLSIEKNNLTKIEQKISEYNEILLAADLKVRKVPLAIDGWTNFNQLDQTFFNIQDKFEPFGEQNHKLALGINQVRITDIQPLGKTNKHLKLFLGENGKNYQVIAFFAENLIGNLAIGTVIDVVVEGQKNYYNGMIQYQLLLVDLRFPQKQWFDYRNIRYSNVFHDEQNSFDIVTIPTNIIEFYQLFQDDNIEKIYLKQINYEDKFMYAKEIENKYFEYLYKYILKYQPLDLNNEQMYQEFYEKGLPKSVLLYIISVFFELDFVIIDENICTILPTKQKIALTESTKYNEQNKWLEMRNALLYEPIEKIQAFFTKNSSTL